MNSWLLNYDGYKAMKKYIVILKRKRYDHKKIKEWCEKNDITEIDKFSLVGVYIHKNNVELTYYFENEDDALAFKLRWS